MRHPQLIPTVPFYKERVLTNISIGGVLILVVLKTIQSNIAKMRVSFEQVLFPNLFKSYLLFLKE